MCEFPYYIFATTGQQVYLEFIKISIQSKHDTNKEKQAIQLHGFEEQLWVLKVQLPFPDH